MRRITSRISAFMLLVAFLSLPFVSGCEIDEHEHHHHHEWHDEEWHEHH